MSIIQPHFSKVEILSWVYVSLFITLASILYFWDLLAVPFHPDESTQIYMSSDIELIFKEPKSFFFSQTPSNPIRQSYRLLDAPLTRYLIGIARNLSDIPPLKSDWDWSKTWDQNIDADAFPSDSQLLVSRLSTAIFFPFSLFFLFKLGKQITSHLLGWLFMAFYTINPLILLHTRRAMSEGPLVFFIILFLWIIIKNQKNWPLAAIVIALAINTKYSAAPLAFVVLLILLFKIIRKTDNWRNILTISIGSMTIVIFVTFLLNPILWSNPLRSINTAIIARSNLITNQVEDLHKVAPERVLDSYGDRSLSVIGNLYFSPLAFYDYGNYSLRTKQSEISYLANPLNGSFRNKTGGILLFFFTLLGLGLSLFEIKKYRDDHPNAWLIILLGFLCELAFFLVSVPLPYQRYIIPLLPFVILWEAAGIYSLLRLMRKRVLKTEKPG